MITIPSPETILQLLDRLDEVVADDLETEHLDFKRWRGAKESMAEAVEMAVCLANADGGVVVFGVKDRVRGREQAVAGCDRYDLDEWRRGIYLHHSSPMDLDFRMDLKTPLLHTLERLTEAINVRNPFKTLKTGLFHVDIPAFPETAFREAILNALIHRDYLEPGSVYVRHADREMNISSPGGFIGGITPENVLHAEPKARNRRLAEIFQKIGLVERAGIGRRRIFIPLLAFGKRAPLYEADPHTVKLTLFDGSFDQELATFIGTRERQGETFDVTELLLLSFLREHAEVDVNTASRITQLPEARVRDRLEQFCYRPNPWLERRGKKSGVTYHLSRAVAAELVGKGVYIRSKAIDKVQWPVMIRQYVEEHGSINNSTFGVELTG